MPLANIGKLREKRCHRVKGEKEGDERTPTLTLWILTSESRSNLPIF